MAKFFQTTIGGKQVEIPITDDSPEGITAGLRQAFPNSEIRFPSTTEELEDFAPVTTTTPTTDPDGGGLSLTRLAQVLTGTTSREADRTRAQNPIAQALRERTLDPLLRLNRPAGGDIERLFGPEPGMASRAADVATLGTAAAAPALSGIGMAAQAGTQALGQSPETARLAGGITELLSGLVGAMGVGALVGRAGKKLIATAPAEIKALPVANDLLPMEKVSSELTGALSREFRSRSARLGAEFDTIEREAVGANPTVLPGTTAYEKLAGIVDYTNDSVATFGGVGGESVQRIANAVANNEPIAASEIIRLRKGLKDLASRGRSFDPDTAANAKKAIHVRNEAGAALEATMDPQTLERWRATNAAWGSTVAEPLSVLHNVLDNKSAFAAFQSVFQNQDPEVFRTVLRVAQTTPSVAGRLKLGFLEVLRENTNTFQNAGKFQAIFEQVKPMVEGAGLFSRDELNALDTFIRRKSIIPVTSAISQALSSAQGVLRLGSGLAITSAITHDPTALFIAGAASGALPAMRRLAILPPGSAAGKRAALEVANQIAKFADAMSADRTRPREAGETPAR